jgi:starch-binding outer membrane protein SusE/F
MKDINKKIITMKTIKFLALLLITVIGFNACESDDSLTYTAQPNGELAFSNSFLSEYILTPAASGNLGERFTWNDADFDVETEINYELQKSITGDFTDMELVGSTNQNAYAITIGDMLQYAAEAGLDNDASTADIPNTGNVYFRLRASVGTDSSVELMSETQALVLVLPESTGNEGPVCELDQLWAVGAGLPDAGWGWNTPVSLPCTGNGIYSWNVNLLNAEAFRFFTSEGDWGSGQNFPYFIGEGYTIDSNFEDALDDDNNFRFLGTTGYYNLMVNTVDKTITLDNPQATGNCEYDQLWVVGAGAVDAGWGWTSPVQLVCTGEGIYSGSINLQNIGGADNNFRFFTVEGDWGSGQNFPYYADAGYTMSSNLENALDDDSNFAFNGTTGSYFITIDTVALTITLE